MKKLTNNSFNLLFRRLLKAKDKFCLKVIIRLDKIITFCSSKQLINEVEKEQNELKNFKEFSYKFTKNKEQLKTNIELVLRENEKFKDDLEFLYWCFMNNEINQMEVVFKKYNFKEKSKIDK